MQKPLKKRSKKGGNAVQQRRNAPRKAIAKKVTSSSLHKGVAAKQVIRKKAYALGIRKAESAVAQRAIKERGTKGQFTLLNLAAAPKVKAKKNNSKGSKR